MAWFDTTIRPSRIAIGVALPVLVFGSISWFNGRIQLDRIELPDGFHLSVYADDTPNAREMALGDHGTVFVGSRRAGKVYAVVDSDGDQVADRTWVIDEDLNMPSGLAFRDGALYVGAVSRILRYDDIESRLANPPEPVVVRDDLPTERHHGWKFLRFGPDGWLYVPVGGPCNVCLQTDERYASILRMRPDGSDLEVYASGIRNTVGFDWDPRTGELWFTDNGRDMLGDDVPDDELNHAPRAGLHFGFPFCHAGTVPDPDFTDRSCEEFQGPALRLGAHVAAIGMQFYTGTMFPPEYRDNIFIAQHGSWNRSSKVGYRVMRVVIENNEVQAYEPFATGWLQGDEVSGRPAAVLVMPDGALLVSDDLRGVIYRIAYGDS